MKFKAIQFQDANVQRVYDNYINNIRTAVRPLAAADREETLMEFNSHIYGHLEKNQGTHELDALLDIIDKLGTPSEVLKPLIADKMLDKATRTFNPVHIAKALLLNLTNGISYIVFAILYLFLGTFIFCAGAKIFDPEVGMYYKDGKFQAIGMIRGGQGYEEVLGYWFIPVMLLIAFTLYIIITLLLRLKRSFNKRMK